MEEVLKDQIIKNTKRVIQKAFKNYLGIKVSIRVIKIENKKKPKQRVEKETFVRIINNILETSSKVDFLYEKLGIDITLFEEQYINIIHDLFGLRFNEAQQGIIFNYLYEEGGSEETVMQITITDSNKKTKTYEVDSPESLWDLLNQIEKELN